MSVNLALRTGLSISFEVDIPTGKVGGSLLFERRRSEFSRVSGGMLPPPPKKKKKKKNLEFRCLEMLFLMLSRQYLGLKNNQN